jgi:hypothetical protein
MIQGQTVVILILLNTKGRQPARPRVKYLKKIIVGKFGQEWVMQLWQWHFIEFSTVAHCHPAQLIALVCPRRYLTQP